MATVTAVEVERGMTVRAKHGWSLVRKVHKNPDTVALHVDGPNPGTEKHVLLRAHADPLQVQAGAPAKGGAPEGGEARRGLRPAQHRRRNEAGQRAEIGRWLSGNGVEPGLVRWFVDKKSGDSLDRPAFNKLKSSVFAGEVGTVVVYKLDRLSRSLRDGIETLCDWCDRGLRVVSVTQQIDFNGTLGKMLAAVLIGVAEMEQETRRERQAAGIRAAKAEGKYRGRKPGTTKATPARARKLREKGLTAEEIGAALGVSRNTVFRYLRATGD